jgi:hypothetical protein
MEYVRVVGIYRDDFQIWGCVGGVTAYTPPYLSTFTAIPEEPYVKNYTTVRHLQDGKLPAEWSYHFDF